MKTVEKIGIICGVGIAVYLIARYVMAKKPQLETGTLRIQIDNESNQNVTVKISSKEEGEIASIPVNAGQSISKDIELKPGIYTISIWYASSLLYAKDVKVEANKVNVFGYNTPHGAVVHSVA